MWINVPRILWLNPNMLRKHCARLSNYCTTESDLIKPKCSMINTHPCFRIFCECLPYETEHFSSKFTNGSSSDATGNNWRFQAENLSQITIYQVMKPLKIIPHPSVATVLIAALLSISACTQSFGMSHHFIVHTILLNKTIAKMQEKALDAIEPETILIQKL